MFKLWGGGGGSPGDKPATNFIFYESLQAITAIIAYYILAALCQPDKINCWKYFRKGEADAHMQALSVPK